MDRRRMLVLGMLSRISSQFTYYVDSVNGDDGNTGTSEAQAFQTLAAVPTLAAGQSVGLARGSTWRGEGIIVPANNIRIQAYGIGDRPIIDGSETVANDDFAKTGGQTNVYQASLTIEANASGTSYVRVWEDGTLLARASSLANCDATPGSYYPSADSTTPITLYVHASDSSDVSASSKVYDATTCLRPISCDSATGLHVTNVVCKRGLHDSQVTLGINAVSTGCDYLEGGKHNVYVRDGAAIYGGTIAYGYRHDQTASLLVFNENTSDGSPILLDGVAFAANPAQVGVTLNIPINGHINVDTSNQANYFGKVTIKDCSFTNFRTNGQMFDCNHCNGVEFINPTFTGCYRGIGGTATMTTGSGVTVSGGSWQNGAGGHRAIYANAAIPFVIDDFTLYADSDTGTGYVDITANATVTITNSTFYNRASGTGLRQPFICTATDAELTLTDNTYGGDYNWTRLYDFAAGASGMTWESDRNVFGPNFAMRVFGTNYTDLATYQAAVSQDAASSLAA